MTLITLVSAGRAIWHKQSMRFLDCIENCFLMQMIREPTRRCWTCYSKNKEELIEDLKVKGSLGCSNCETVEFKILREVSKINSRITAPDFRRADLGLSREAFMGNCAPGQKARGELADLQGQPPQNTGTVHNVQKVEQAWQKASMDEHGAPA